MTSFQWRGQQRFYRPTNLDRRLQRACSATPRVIMTGAAAASKGRKGRFAPELQVAFGSCSVRFCIPE
eukprot:2280516-Alexandrium_andersonii.AAC.1